MIGNTPDFARDRIGRQNNIDKTGANGAARPRIELRARFSLREGQTAGCFDLTQSGRPIAASPGKHDANRTTAAFLGKRYKKVIDRDAESLFAADQRKLAIFG